MWGLAAKGGSAIQVLGGYMVTWMHREASFRVV